MGLISKQKNKLKKSILIVCIILITMFLFTLLSDEGKVRNNEPPRFARLVSEKNGVKEYIGFGYRVYYQKNSFYGITFLWAGEEDLSLGDPMHNILKVIFSGNLV